MKKQIVSYGKLPSSVKAAYERESLEKDFYKTDLVYHGKKVSGVRFDYEDISYLIILPTINTMSSVIDSVEVGYMESDFYYD